MSSPLYPLTFKPVLKSYIWGGRNLEKIGRSLPSGRIAESWEIAAHEDGTTVVDNGRFAGMLLTKLHEQLGLDLIGRKNSWAQERHKFPLLVKLLDANQPLSVQVHPGDDYALNHEGNELGKTEMWLVLQARPKAAVVLGLKAGTTPDLFRRAVQKGKVESYLHHIPVKNGDVVCVPSGSLHAIMGELLIAEIQQNSNTTYRVYDWNRLGASGMPRPLHLDKAMEVINFNQIEPKLSTPLMIDETDGVRHYRLCQNRYFVTDRIELESGAIYKGLCDGDSLQILGAIEGRAVVNGVELSAIRFTLLPASLGAYSLIATTNTVLLRTYVA